MTLWALALESLHPSRSRKFSAENTLMAALGTYFFSMAVKKFSYVVTNWPTDYSCYCAFSLRGDLYPVQNINVTFESVYNKFL